MRLWLVSFFALLIMASPAAAEIKIGVAAPITGPMATFGEQFTHGAKIAVDVINESGGVLGEQLELVIADDVCDPKQAVAVANQLANKGIKLVVGHFCSGASIPASDIYEEEDILMISPGSTNPLLTERGLQNVFRVCGRDDQQGQVAATYIHENFADKKIALIDDKSAYGKGLASETKRVLASYNMMPILEESINAGDKDFSALISKLKFSGADLVFFGGYHLEAGLMLRQMMEQDYKPIFISGDSLATDEFWDVAGESAKGVLMTFPDPKLDEEAAAAILARFEKAGIEPKAYTLFTYAVVEVYREALEKAGKLDVAALRNVLATQDFQTVLGNIGFDEKGDVKAPGYVLYRWQDGDYHQLSE